MNRLTALLMLFLTGCGTPLLVGDDTQLSPDEARVVIYPIFQFGRTAPRDVEIEFTRIIDAKRRSSMLLKYIPNNQVSVIALEPGVYFVSAFNSGDHYRRFGSEGFETLFEVKKGQLNYPGSWKLAGIVHKAQVSGTMADGSASIEYSLAFSVVEDKKLLDKVRVTHPKITGELPFKFTWIDLKNPEAVRRVESGE